MILTPARSSIVLIICFIFTIGTVFAGAWFYKYSNNFVATPTVMQPQEEVTDAIEYPTVQLVLRPTETTNEYQVVVTDLTDLVNTIAFQINSVGGTAPILSSSITLDPNLQQAGWSTIVNTDSNSETGQRFAFSMARIGVTTDTSTPQEIVIGTIQIADQSDISLLTIDESESFVSYSNSEIPAKIVLLSNAENTEIIE